MIPGLPMGLSGKESTCQSRRCKRHEFDPWVRKIPWSRKWQPTPVFLPGKIPWTEEPGRLQSMGSQIVGHDCDSARMNEWENEWKENGLTPLNISLLKGKREKSSRAPHCTPLFRTCCCSLQELSLNTLHSSCYYLTLFSLFFYHLSTRM